MRLGYIDTREGADELERKSQHLLGTAERQYQPLVVIGDGATRKRVDLGYFGNLFEYFDNGMPDLLIFLPPRFPIWASFGLARQTALYR